MGPLELLYSWQALLISIAATGFTQLLKTVIDIVFGQRDATPTPTMKDAQAVGAKLRREMLILNRLVLPMAPIFFGFIMAMVVPMRPEMLLTYVTTEHIEGVGRYLVFGAWGAACGQFADYGYSKVKSMLGDARGRSASRSTPPPPADGAPAP
jgi:hypothetical protein